MKKRTIELRNASRKLIAKYYPDDGIVEIIQKGDYSRIILPPQTVIIYETGKIACR